MKRTCKLSLSFLCFLICFLLSMSGIRARDEALAADIAPKILRFHVLANSDSAKDQALKLRVKHISCLNLPHWKPQQKTLSTASGMITLYMWGSRPAGFRCAPTGT